MPQGLQILYRCGPFALGDTPKKLKHRPTGAAYGRASTAAPRASELLKDLQPPRHDPGSTLPRSGLARTASRASPCAKPRGNLLSCVFFFARPSGMPSHRPARTASRAYRFLKRAKSRARKSHARWRFARTSFRALSNLLAVRGGEGPSPSPPPCVCETLAKTRHPIRKTKDAVFAFADLATGPTPGLTHTNIPPPFPPHTASFASQNLSCAFSLTYPPELFGRGR